MTGNVKVDQKKRKSAPAQALVEVAIVLPMLLLLVLGALDFGRMFYIKIVLTNAAREGANYLAMDPCDALVVSGNIADGVFFKNTIQAIQSEAVSSGVSIIPGDIAISCTSDSYNCCERGTEFTVTVPQEVDLIFDGFLQTMGLIGGPLQLTGSVTMEVQ